MKSLLLLFSIFSLFSASLALAHGPAGDGTVPMGSQMMLRMMEMMHGTMDENRALNCGAISQDALMEKGEEMMETMMGKEQHEKVEGLLTKDAHDQMHTMMGMWATGCVGDEALNSMMDRYGISSRLSELERKTQNQMDWPIVALGVILGAVGGWFGNQLLHKKQ